MLSSSSNIHCEEAQSWKGSQGCSSNPSCKVVLQMARAPSQTKLLARSFPWGSAMCFQDQKGDDQDDHVPSSKPEDFLCCHSLQRRQVLTLLGEADQSQPDPQQSFLPDAWQHLEPFVTFKDTASTFHPNNHARYQKTNGKRGSQSLILASIFFLCFLVLGWPGQVDKLLKKGKYHFNLFLQLIMANHRKADSNSRLATAL